MKLGTLLASIAKEVGHLTKGEARQFDELRDKTPAEPLALNREQRVPAIRNDCANEER